MVVSFAVWKTITSGCGEVVFMVFVGTYSWWGGGAAWLPCDDVGWNAWVCKTAWLVSSMEQGLALYFLKKKKHCNIVLH
jgi:hypothetical protein